MHYRWSIAKAGWSQTFLCADSALNPGVEILAIWDQRQQRVMLRSCSSPAERLTHWQRASVSIPAPWWEANYRREREKTLAALISPPCFFKKRPLRGFPGKSPAEECAPTSQGAALFHLDQKIPRLPKSPLLYCTFFPFATFLWLSPLCKSF